MRTPIDREDMYKAADDRTKGWITSRSSHEVLFTLADIHSTLQCYLLIAS
jgi:hypothetical protein